MESAVSGGVTSYYQYIKLLCISVYMLAELCYFSRL